MKRQRAADKKRYLYFFIIGIITGCIASFIFYRAQAPKRPVPIKPILPKPAQFKIAIVLDDFGYNYKNVEAAFALKRPITFSILPHLSYSKTIARRVSQKGYEAILHLPLEAREKEKHIRPESGTITVNMKAAEVLDKLSKAIEAVPFSKGVSNHQGSRATESPFLMKIIFTGLKTRNLFFIDSLVTGKSVCRRIAKEVGIKFGRRDVFLDNNTDFEYIKGQMKQLVRKAKKTGFGIGIGHDKTQTISALAKLMPLAEAEGAKFVFVSELVR